MSNDDDDLDAFFDEVDADVEKITNNNGNEDEEEDGTNNVTSLDEDDKKIELNPIVVDENNSTPQLDNQKDDAIAPPAKKKSKTSNNTSHNRSSGVVVVSKSAVTSVVATMNPPDLPSHNHSINPLSTTIHSNGSSSIIQPPLPKGQPPSFSNSSSSSFHYYNNNNALNHRSTTSSTIQPQQPPPPSQPQPMDPKMSKKVIKRSSAGQSWEDPSLAQFPANDFRLFVGNLAKDITDAKLAEAFQSKYTSFAMAKVIFSKQDGKSKGYGFVSLMDPKDCARAIREMDQSWIGSRPIKVKRSDWKERSLSQVMKNKKKKHKKRNNWL